MTYQDLQKWAKEASPGAWTVYHIGYLAKDREWFEQGEWDVLPRLVKDKMIHNVGHAAMGLYREGTVDLVQKRLGPKRWEYRIVKRKRVRRFL